MSRWDHNLGDVYKVAHEWLDFAHNWAPLSRTSTCHSWHSNDPFLGAEIPAVLGEMKRPFTFCSSLSSRICTNFGKYSN